MVIIFVNVFQTINFVFKVDWKLKKELLFQEVSSILTLPTWETLWTLGVRKRRRQQQQSWRERTYFPFCYRGLERQLYIKGGEPGNNILLDGKSNVETMIITRMRIRMLMMSQSGCFILPGWLWMGSSVAITLIVSTGDHALAFINLFFSWRFF